MSITLDGTNGATISGGITGTTTNDSAAAGDVGEYVSSAVAANTVSLTTGTPVTLTSISLTAGDWEVWGNVAYLPAASTSVTIMEGGTSTTNNTVDSTMGKFTQSVFAATVPGASTQILHFSPYRYSLAATTTIYLVGYVTFTVSTCTGGGRIAARRVR